MAVLYVHALAHTGCSGRMIATSRSAKTRTSYSSRLTTHHLYSISAASLRAIMPLPRRSVKPRAHRLRAGTSITAPTAARSLASGRWTIAPWQSVAIVRSACMVFASESSLVRRMRTSAEVTRTGTACASTARLNSFADWHQPRSAQEKLGLPFQTVATPTRPWLCTCDASFAIVTAERAQTGRALLAEGHLDARPR